MNEEQPEFGPGILGRVQAITDLYLAVKAEYDAWLAAERMVGRCPTWVIRGTRIEPEIEDEP